LAGKRGINCPKEAIIFLTGVEELPEKGMPKKRTDFHKGRLRKRGTLGLPKKLLKEIP